MVKRFIILLCCLLLVFGAIFGWKAYQGMQMAKRFAHPRPPVSVATTMVSEETWQPYLTAVGSLTAPQEVYVSNEIPGQVRQIHFHSGTQVTRGKLLLQLNDDVDRAELKGLFAERALARLQFQRMSRLFKTGKLASRADLDEARAKLDRAAANVDAKRALIEKKRILAPFSGYLGIRQVNLGQYLAAGSRIVRLQRFDPIYVDYSLPEREFSQLALKQKVTISVQAFPRRTFSGQISALEPGITQATRNLRIRATLKNPDGGLRPGMFAEVHSLMSARHSVLTVPRMAISYAPYGDSVYVVIKKNGALIVQRRQVATGAVRGRKVAIKTGLQADEQVVIAGQLKLRNGQRVVVNNSVKLDRQPIGP